MWSGQLLYVTALILDVMHLATWSVVCAWSPDAGGTVHSKECPLLFAIRMYVLTSELSSLLATCISAGALDCFYNNLGVRNCVQVAQNCLQSVSRPMIYLPVSLSAAR